jgi:hypothetical protein
VGQERDCRLRYAGKTWAGKAYLETDYILFRGEQRLKIPLRGIASAAAEGGKLRIEFPGGPAVFELGDAAAKWAQKILHPPSRLDKLGVKPGSKIQLIGAFDPDFVSEVASAAASPPDLVFFSANKTTDLRRLPKIPAGAALWVVYPKGIEAIREVEVIEAGRAAGLKDTKVARFSHTHTALRFNRAR